MDIDFSKPEEVYALLGKGEVRASQWQQIVKELEAHLLANGKAHELCDFIGWAKSHGAKFNERAISKRIDILEYWIEGDNGELTYAENAQKFLETVQTDYEDLDYYMTYLIARHNFAKRYNHEGLLDIAGETNAVLEKQIEQYAKARDYESLMVVIEGSGNDRLMQEYAEYMGDNNVYEAIEMINLFITDRLNNSPKAGVSWEWDEKKKTKVRVYNGANMSAAQKSASGMLRELDQAGIRYSLPSSMALGEAYEASYDVPCNLV